MQLGTAVHCFCPQEFLDSLGQPGCLLSWIVFDLKKLKSHSLQGHESYSLMKRLWEIKQFFDSLSLNSMRNISSIFCKAAFCRRSDSSNSTGVREAGIKLLGASQLDSERNDLLSFPISTISYSPKRCK